MKRKKSPAERLEQFALEARALIAQAQMQARAAVDKRRKAKPKAGEAKPPSSNMHTSPPPPDFYNDGDTIQ